MPEITKLPSDFLAEITAVRQYLHANPECSNQEFATTRYISSYLEALDIKCLPTTLATGVVAEIGGLVPGPTIALRADIDALPIKETTGLSYTSTKEGVMHACGHDFHTASLLGAATLLKAQEAQLKGTVRLLFQPAEEDNKGARLLLEDGQLDGVSAVIGYHNKPDLPVGTIGLKEGPLMAAVDRFTITIKGVGTHAGAPHNGSDPIVTASQIVTVLQSIVSRHVSPLESAVISVAHIHGGNTWNVIPETVFIEGTIRTFKDEVKQKVKDIITQVVTTYPVAFGQTGVIDWLPSLPAVWNEERLTARVITVTQGIAKVICPEVTFGGDDFACLQEKIPGVYAFIGSNGPHEWHHPAFQIDDRGLEVAIQYYVNNALALLP